MKTKPFNYQKYQRVFCDQENHEGKQIGLALGLQQVYFTLSDFATMPYLIAAKAHTSKWTSGLWNTWFTAFSEEYVGIDAKGRLGQKGESVVVTLHGGGILTPERVRQAYSEQLTPQNAAKLHEDEFDNLLTGIVDYKQTIQLYSIKEVKQGRIPDCMGRYAIWLPASAVGSSGQLTRSDFLSNNLVLARAGTPEFLEMYFEKARGDKGVGNWHRLGQISFHQPQGYMLAINVDHHGLDGTVNLHYGAHFISIPSRR